MKNKFILVFSAFIFLFIISNAYAADTCLYATSASATSQYSQSLATYALGAPNSPSQNECSNWGGAGIDWEPSNYNVKGNLTLKYNLNAPVKNFTVFGDYDICYSRIYLKNSLTGQTLVVSNQTTVCTLNKNVNNFTADTVIIETCGTNWASTDAVRVCFAQSNNSNTTLPVCGNGINQTGEECDDGNLINGDGCSSICKKENITAPVCGNGINQTGEECDDGNLINGDGCSSICKKENILPSGNVCLYATSASATSQYSQSLATYALGAPNSPSQNECSNWGGAGIDWEPSNYNVKGNLTLKYNLNAPVKNFTVFGDYDICYSRIYLKNSLTGQTLVVSNQTTVCTLNKNVNNFTADTVIIETCGTNWASTDAVRVCFAQSNNSNTTLPVCGNGINQTGEECDDGNLINGDGCSSICKKENILPSGNVCLYATSATATSQYSQSLASYATGAPNSPSQNECSNWGGAGIDWEPSNYNVKGNLTLKYNLNAPVKNFTVFGDYDICYNKIYLKNSLTGQTLVVSNRTTVCTLTQSVNNFVADTMIIETCGTNWASTDAVRVCFAQSNNSNTTIPVCGNGINQTGEECDDGNLINGDGCSSLCKKEINSLKVVCEYAKSASATSENVGSEAAYALGAPDSLNQGECANWSGFGYTWNPTNWDVKANITLNYNLFFNVSNFTIYGDYDICWSRAWIKNSASGQTLQIFNEINTTCTLTKQLPANFSADTVILETCGTSWTSTDAVKVCGSMYNNTNTNNTNTSNQKISVCTWKDCKGGAVSVSVDDSFTACSDILEQNGYRGTYFLTDTNILTAAEWTDLNNLFKNGHELGTHTQTHICAAVDDATYKTDMQNNINDILAHTDAKQNDLISHAYACGFVTQNISQIIKNNWNFLSARGYYFNGLESSTPINFFDLKSYNSHDYPGGTYEPPNYFTEIDKAVQQGKWANLVFHIDCSDDGVISSLPTKNVWVDTIGNVVKYIKLRDSSVISDIAETSSHITFKVKSDYTLNYYNQNITLKVNMNATPTQVRVNNQNVPFVWNGNYTRFNVQFPINSNIDITK